MSDSDFEPLQRAGLRATRQRRRILDGLGGRRDAVTALGLYDELSHSDEPVGLATVYRTLQALADAGLLDTFDAGGEQAFRRCGDTHHHHVVCERCGLVTEITAEEVESWVSEVASRRRFRVTGHRADVFGVCADCQAAESG